SFEGTYYRLHDAEFFPKPVQHPHPPLILGGKAVGPRMQRLIGRYADEFNTVGGLPEEVAGRFARARDGFEAEGRDPSSLVTSLMTWFFVGATEHEYLEKLHRAHAIDPDAGPFENYRAEIERDCIVGSSGRAASRLREYAAAGVQRIFLNHELYDDLEMLEVVATDVVSLAGGMPYVEALPGQEVLEVATQVLRDHGPTALQYGGGQGQLALRDRAVMLMAEEGVEADPDDVVITTGAQQALDLLGKIFIDPDDTIAVEAPAYVGALTAFAAYQPRFLTIELDDEGMIVEQLEQAIVRGERPTFVYTVPNFGNPAG